MSVTPLSMTQQHLLVLDQWPACSDQLNYKDIPQGAGNALQENIIFSP